MKYLLILLILIRYDPAISRDYQSIEIPDTRLVVKIPTDFIGQFDVPKTQQYRSKAKIPAFIYRNKDKSAKIRFENIGSRSNNKLMEKYVVTYASIFKNSVPQASFSIVAVREINKRKIGIIEFTQSKNRKKIYTLIFMITVDGKMVMGSIEYAQNDVERSKKLAWAVVNSLGVK